MAGEADRSRVLRVEFQYPEGIVSRYATNIMVQHTENEFVISFFEALPTPTLPDL